MLVTGQPLIELFGLEPARKAGIVVIGGDKEDVEDVGLGKLDLLVLRALSVVQEGANLEKDRGIPLELHQIDLEDPEIYAMLRRADTMGASQVESRAQMQSVVRTQPHNFRDLINQCAIIRPGPIVAGMVHPYNRRRLGLEKVTFLHPSLAPITGDTLGIFLFQEQIILGVMALTGCSAGEADVFRRAMGSHRSREAMQRLQPWFIERAVANGIELATATEAFRQISGFADFGFCRSHSAALARTAYEGLFLKRYHPAAFYAAVVSNQPMGFYPVEVLIWDGRRRGIQFLPVDANLSAARCTLSNPPAFFPSQRPRDLPPQPPVRLGFEQVRWVGREIAARIVRERDAGGPYRSLADFCQRTGLTGKPAEGLVLAGAFEFEGQSRQDQLWALYGHVGRPEQPSLSLSEEEAELPERTRHDQVLLDHFVLSFSLDRHLVESYRRRLRALGVTPSDQIGRIPDGREVRVGGLVVCRQRPGTAKGFVFLTLEDEHGLVNVVIRPDVYQQYREALRNSMLVAIAGKIQKALGTINIVASRAISLDPRVPDAEVMRRPFAPIEAGVKSHNFH
jgi:error-prone DNA polymerase